MVFFITMKGDTQNVLPNAMSRLCQLMGAEGVVGIVSIHILEHTRLRSLSEGKADM